MGAIRETATGRVRLLEAHHVVGRAPPPQCALSLDARYISEFHAEIRWTGDAWEVKDLASTNGTFVDGRRMASGHSSRVAKSSKLGFGKREHEWEIVDDSSPVPMVVPVDGGDPITAGERNMIALPDETDPQLSIYKTVDGSWVLERPDAMPVGVADRQTFEALGRVWRFCCPESAGASTLPVETRECPAYVHELQLVFSVTRDEEYVHLRVLHGERRIDMGARQHHFLLLTLARRWVAEAAAGEPEVSCGWLEQEEVAHDPSMAASRLNLSVFRIREQFAKIGVVDFASIVQRRMHRIRIGTGRITIQTL